MKITPMTNANGEIDYGHAYRYYQMGLIDEYGNGIPMPTEWEVLNNTQRRATFDERD